MDNKGQRDAEEEGQKDISRENELATRNLSEVKSQEEKDEEQQQIKQEKLFNKNQNKHKQQAENEDSEINNKSNKKMKETQKQKQKFNPEEQKDKTDKRLDEQERMFREYMAQLQQENPIQLWQQFLNNIEEAVRMHGQQFQPLNQEQVQPLGQDQLQQQAVAEAQAQELAEQVRVAEQIQMNEMIREEEKRRQQIQRKRKEKSNKECCYFFYGFLVVFILMMGLQYHQVIYSKIQKFKISNEINYYALLHIDSNLTDDQLAYQYKYMQTRCSPEENPDCYDCSEKLNMMTKAWIILTDPDKRKHYDQNTEFIHQIKSTAVTLTPENYDHLVANSNSLWVIQVYDSTNSYCHHFAPVWQKTVQHYKDLVLFGRIDVWQQSNMLSTIPYHFKIFPGMYLVHKGKPLHCTMNYDTPLASIKICIEAEYKNNLFIKIVRSQEILKQPNKLTVLYGSNANIELPIKIIHQKYWDFFNFYEIKDKLNKIKIREANLQFRFTSKVRAEYKRYELFLASQLKQAKSLCQIHHLCKTQACLIMLKSHLRQPNQTKYPVFIVKEKQSFDQKINQLKMSSKQYDYFDIGIYKNGRIVLGHLNQVNHLNINHGKLIEFECLQEGWIQKIIERTKQMF